MDRELIIMLSPTLWRDIKIVLSSLTLYDYLLLRDIDKGGSPTERCSHNTIMDK